MIIAASIPTRTLAQNWQTFVNVDSRVGYSTNSYLNPFFGEWNSTVSSGYGLTTLSGYTSWFNKGNSLTFTSVLVYEPFFDQQQVDNWTGGLALLDLSRRFSSSFSAGIEGGGSYFTSSFDRTVAWVQPKITWFASPFTSVRLKAGSNFQYYEDFLPDTVDAETDRRFDLYALELETWPSYNWRLTAGLYGNLDNFPNIGEGFNTLLGVGYLFKNGTSLDLRFAWEQYQIQTTAQTGGPPIGGPGGGTTTVEETDRILRLGLSGSFPINRRFSFFTDVEGLKLLSDVSEEVTDYQVSAGIRMSFQPRLGKKSSGLNPEWNEQSSGHQIKVRYSGEGRLYLVGDFNNWNKPGIPLREQSDKTYVAKLNLDTGAYEYKILVVQGDSEEWIEFSNETYTVDDGFGSENALLLVGYANE